MFFNSVDDAIKEGFRPCKLCRPDIIGRLIIRRENTMGYIFELEIGIIKIRIDHLEKIYVIRFGAKYNIDELL